MSEHGYIIFWYANSVTQKWDKQLRTSQISVSLTPIIECNRAMFERFTAYDASKSRSQRLRSKTKLSQLLWRALRPCYSNTYRRMASINGINSDPQAKTLKLENVGFDRVFAPQRFLTHLHRRKSETHLLLLRRSIKKRGRMAEFSTLHHHPIQRLKASRPQRFERSIRNTSPPLPILI